MADVNDITDSELVGRVMRHMASRKRGRKEPLWVRVGDTFCLGSTYSRQLCRKFGADPDAMVGK